MKDFSVEINGANTYLIYKVGADEKIDTVIIGMMEHNSIQGLLPVSILQMNQLKSLRYDISSKVNLVDIFANTVKKEAFIKILLGIMNTLICAEDYMIEQETFIIDMEHIYINPSNYEISMICFPIITENAVQHLDEFVKSLVFSAKYDQTENCDYIAKLINFLNGQPFTVYGFKKQLEEILGIVAHMVEQRSAVISSSNLMETSLLNPQPAQGVMGQEIVQTQSMTQGDNSSIPAEKLISENLQSANGQTVVDSSQFKQNLIPGNPQTAQKKEKHRFFGKRKDKESKSAKQKEEKSKAKTPAPSGISDKLIIPGQMVVNDANGNKVGVSNANTSEGLTGIAGQANLSKLPNTSFEQVQTSFGETTVLGIGGGNSYSNETTVLGIDNTAIPTAYLVRQKNNEQKKITSPFFKIGKEYNSVDYYISDNGAISREHAKILTKGTDYYIVDTNSKNHTYVNGKIIAPNIEIKLSHGTLIRLADEEFEFKMI